MRGGLHVSAQDGNRIRHRKTREEIEAGIKHGTLSGYGLHHYYKILPVCDACKEAAAAHNKRWHKENPSYRQRKWKEFKQLNPDYKKDYHKNKPEQSRKDARRRRARKLGVTSEHYSEQQVLDVYGTNCHLCLEPIDLQAPRQQGSDSGWERGLHLDHIVPVSKGGSDTLDNVRPAHVLCNLQKGVKWNTQESENPTSK